MNRQTIEIDIDVYKAIEARQISFAETQNEILRREFDLASDRNSSPSVGLPRATLREKNRRRSGTYTVTWTGDEVSGVSLKDVLKKTILTLDKESPGLVETLSRH